MELKKIWQGDNIQLFQLHRGDFCLNIVFINNTVAKISSDWDSIVEFLDHHV